MGKLFFTSDLHFGHDREFVWGPRGFNSVQEMNVAIIENWNKVINNDDDIYVLGDLMLGHPTNIMLVGMLNGHIHLVRGNHDTNARMKNYAACSNIVEISEGQFLKIDGQNFYFCHYPCLTSNYDIDKPLKARVINLCGHTHTTDKFLDMDKGLIYHVELDAHNNTPVSIDTILKDIKNYRSN